MNDPTFKYLLAHICGNTMTQDKSKQVFLLTIGVIAIFCAIGFVYVGAGLTDGGEVSQGETVTQEGSNESLAVIQGQSDVSNSEFSSEGNQARATYSQSEDLLYITGQIQGNTGGMNVAVESAEFNEETNEFTVRIVTEEGESDVATQVITFYQYQLTVNQVNADTEITLYHNGEPVEVTHMGDQELYTTEDS